MSEREEGPEGIAGASVAKRRFRPPIWHSGAERKARNAPNPPAGRNFVLKAGFDYGVFCECRVFNRAYSGFCSSWGSLSLWMAMFAHRMNRRKSLARVRTWLEPDGRLFMYILLISTRIATRSRCGAALALVLPRRIRPVRVCRRPRMWRPPFPDDGGIIFRCVSLIAAAKRWLWNFWSGIHPGRYAWFSCTS